MAYIYSCFVDFFVLFFPIFLHCHILYWSVTRRVVPDPGPSSKSESCVAPPERPDGISGSKAQNSMSSPRLSLPPLHHLSVHGRGPQPPI